MQKKYILTALLLLITLQSISQKSEKIYYFGNEYFLIVEGNCIISMQVLSMIFENENSLEPRKFEHRKKVVKRELRSFRNLSPKKIALNFNDLKTNAGHLTYEQIDSIYKLSIEQYLGLELFQQNGYIVFDIAGISNNKSRYNILFHHGTDWLSSYFRVTFLLKRKKILNLEIV